MGYRLQFDGIATPELTRVLEGVERHFNRVQHGFQISARDDTASAASVVCSEENCGNAKVPVDPPSVVWLVEETEIVTAIIVIVALLIGVGLGSRFLTKPPPR
jgi:hypothetical protein